MDYGTDFLLVDNDLVFTGDSDIAVVSGAACVAQDIDQTLKTAFGVLPWDKEAGSTMPLMLNDTAIDPGSVIAELERAALADPRVDPMSILARRKDGEKYRLEFKAVGIIKPEVLEYDLGPDGSLRKGNSHV